MRDMGNSGKLALISSCIGLALLVVTAITLEEGVLFAFLSAAAVGYLSAVAEVFSRRRHLALILGAIGSSLTIGFAIAFLRMWGLAFNEESNAVGTAVKTQDSDSYFYLALAAGFGTMLVLLAGAVLPGARRIPAGRARKSSGKEAAGQPRSKPATSKSKTGTTAARRPVRSTVGQPTAGRPTAGRPTAGRPRAGQSAGRARNSTKAGSAR
jgi:MFS family permease